MIRQTFRSLLRQKAFSASVAGVVALGIGANSAVFAFVYSVLLRGLPFRAADELVVITEANKALDAGLVSPTAYLEWRERNRSFTDMAAFMWWEGSGEEPTLTVSVTPNYFDVMGVKPILGRVFTEEENRAGFGSAMILSYEIWQRKYGGDPSIIGRPVRDGNWNPIVVGIMPPAPVNLNIGWGHIWRPIRLRQQYNRAERTSARYLRAVGRLRPGVNANQAVAELTVIEHGLEKQWPEIFSGFEVHVRSLRATLAGEFRPALLILLATAGCLLLLACASLANMLVARSAAHEREIAIRLALGATRSHLAIRVLASNLMLASIGAVLGLGLCRVTTSIIAYVEPGVGGSQSAAVFAWPVICLCAALGLITATLVSIPVLFSLGRARVHETLKEGARGGTAGRRRQRIRGLLVSAEVALALSLLVVSGLLVRSFVGLLAADLGFKPDHVLLLESNIGDSYYNANSERVGYYRPLFQTLSEVPGVASVGGLRYFPMHARLWSTAVQVRESPFPTDRQPIVYWNRVAGDYFATMSRPLIAGRLPSSREMWEGSESVLVNAAAARELFRNGDAVGKHIQTGDTSHEVIGVVGNVHQAGPSRPPGPEVYSLMSADESTGILTIAIRTRNKPGRELAQAITAAVRHYDRTQAQPTITELNTFLGETLAARRAAARLGSAFALLALVLAAIGIYGLTSYSVTQRTSEFGIRMALGASTGLVVRHVLGSCFRLAGVGILVGLGLSLFAARVLSTFFYGIPSFDPLTFTGAAILLLATALLAAAWPAFRATRINAVDALRSE
jgi:putative ABC transport system permease protein